MLQKEKCYMLNNGVEIPFIGFGTDYLRGEECINAVIHAIECGYRLIDTASVYKNEKEIGIAVKKCIERGIIKRSDIIIETKSHWFGPGYEEVLQSYRESLENFDLDYIDIYALHHSFAGYFSWQKDIVSSWRALEYLYNQGKVKTIGVCNFSYRDLDVLLTSAKVWPALNQLEIHPLHQQKDLVELCRNKDIFVQSWGALAKGKIFKIKELEQIASKYNKSVSQIAIAWNIRHGFSPLARSANFSHIEDNINVYDINISSEDMDYLDSLDGGEYSGHDIAEIAPIGQMPVRDFKNLLPLISSSNETCTKKYKLFGCITFLKIVKESKRITRCYLFGIPILKIDTK